MSLAFRSYQQSRSFIRCGPKAFPVSVAVSEVDHLVLFTGVVRDISDRRELSLGCSRAVERIGAVTASYFSSLGIGRPGVQGTPAASSSL